KLAGAITIVVGNDGSTTVDNVKVDEVKVLNQTGAELPSTGGMGTTLLYAVGGILVLVAVVLLVAKKRAGAGK
ncbi:MAG: LPXTG cell wall anchor domain-containing protein, partial [Clostridia bacterium]|nr:LPXTG cell wall anchor domain-containing protein [Clostridia bacterium]